MSVYKYNKYKISIQHDSAKTQGLRAGDIVRRQYFDGHNTVTYSLLCVLSNGVETVQEPATQKSVKQSYFIGALLDGDEPKNGELLDFARVTNLFDANRSGALYLTSSDDQAPYLDVIDGIAKESSLSYPVGISSIGYEDPLTQYVVRGGAGVSASYQSSELENSRILHLVRTSGSITGGFIGLQQNLTQTLRNPQIVLVSYKVKASRSLSYHVSIGYEDGSQIDGNEQSSATTEWAYKLHTIVIDHSSQFKRTCKLDFGAMNPTDELWIADFNIILLEHLTNFAKACKVRVGKLDGIVDPVFGTLSGYGGYLQKLYASRSTHISGTLTAGDENGFGSTFYAGKIHRNAFINSLKPTFLAKVDERHDVSNPSGIGSVYYTSSRLPMKAQSHAWIEQHSHERYVFSFWAYCIHPCNLVFLQNGVQLGVLTISSYQTNQWVRYHYTFQIQVPKDGQSDLLLEILSRPVEVSESITTTPLYFSAPQLEAGEYPTQYQATSDVLKYVDDYGAWFAKGGVGGTIQDPLLRLNEDGSISSKNDSFVINSDGSGHFAGGKFQWTQSQITLRDFVVRWEDFDDGVKEQLKPKNIRIVGPNTFVQENGVFTPEVIQLNLHTVNMDGLSSSQVEWKYLTSDGSYAPYPENHTTSIAVRPFDSYWGGKNSVTIKCSVLLNNILYEDTITLYKVQNGEYAYSVQIFSSNGNVFKNGSGQTELTAVVYQGGTDITSRLSASQFDWIRTSSNTSADSSFNSSHRGFGNKLTVTYSEISNVVQFDCQVRIQ